MMLIFTSARMSWVFSEETPLHPLASDGNPANIKEVLEEGADINAGAVIRLRETRLSLTGVTPLHVAALGNPEPVVAELLPDQGAEITARDDGGRTPLQYADSTQSRLESKGSEAIASSVGQQFWGVLGTRILQFHG